MATLCRARDADDTAAILAELHALRGALGVFNMQHMAALCMDLEQDVRANGVRACSTGVKQLCDALQTSVISPPESLHDLLERMLSLADAKAPEDAMAQIAVLARQAQQRLRDG